MDLQGIISVSGKPGLYKIISRSRGGIIVESLTDSKKMPVHASNKVSALEDISMYTYTEDVPLKDILSKIYQHTDGQNAPHPKAENAELFDFFREVLPEYDEDRVYASDIKKLYAWYNVLLEKGLLLPSEEAKQAEENKSAIEDIEAEEVDNSDSLAAETPKPKTAKKAAAKKKTEEQ